MTYTSMVRIWQNDKRTDDYKIVLKCVQKLMKKGGKGPNFFKKKFILRTLALSDDRIYTEVKKINICGLNFFQ